MKSIRILLLTLLLTPPAPCAAKGPVEKGPPPYPPPALADPRPLPPLPDGAFTLVVIPDSQCYLGRDTKLQPDSQEPVTNPYLDNHTRWICENRSAQNIVFVSHVGDIVDRNRPEQWAVARAHLDRLRGAVPFGLVVGNHDMTEKGKARRFQETFPAASFRAYPWYLGPHEHGRPDQEISADNVNSAQIFRAGGMEFLVLHLECNAPDDVLAWADATIRRHAGRRVIVATHMYLGVIEKPASEAGYHSDAQGVMRWTKVHGRRGNSGEQLWEKLLRKHPNIGFLLCGDQSRVTSLHVTRRGDAGNTVHALLSDYMSRGGLRLMRFVPGADRVDVVSYDTTLGALVESMPYKPGRDFHQFTLAYDMAPAPAPTP